MPKTVLPEVHFSRGLMIRRSINVAFSVRLPRDDWYVVGNLSDGTPFMLSHELVPHWNSPQRLSEALRKKILREFKARIATRPYPTFVEHYDLTAVPDDDPEDPQSASQQALALYLAFVQNVWQPRNGMPTQETD